MKCLLARVQVKFSHQPSEITKVCIWQMYIVHTTQLVYDFMYKWMNEWMYVCTYVRIKKKISTPIKIWHFLDCTEIWHEHAKLKFKNILLFWNCLNHFSFLSAADTCCLIQYYDCLCNIICIWSESSNTTFADTQTQ